MNKKVLSHKLFLIGGGVMRLNETVQIDKFLIKQTHKKNPNVLFIPTASNDLDAYIKDFEMRYKSYGADVYTLQLILEKNSQLEIESNILNADLIYIGGGDAILLQKIFNKHKIIELLKVALRNGVPIAGLSAGAVIWGKHYVNFEWDGNKFSNFNRQNGYGIIDQGIWCHYNKDDLHRVSELNIPNQILGISDRVMIFFDENKRIRTFSDLTNDVKITNIDNIHAFTI